SHISNNTRFQQYFHYNNYNNNNLSSFSISSIIRTITTTNVIMSSKSHPLIDKHAPKNLVLKNQEGESVELNSYIGNQKPCIIFFYPQDETYEAGATVFGISSDTVEKHKNFAKKQNLQFSLLSDPNGEARRAFEVPKTLGLLPGRATFLIDKEGIIKDVYNSQLDFQGHANKSLEFIKSQ
ncbi:12761_t:CDS:2, partial [Entrophospora sp. SA101]